MEPSFPSSPPNDPVSKEVKAVCNMGDFGLFLRQLETHVSEDCLQLLFHGLRLGFCPITPQNRPRNGRRGSARVSSPFAFVIGQVQVGGFHILIGGGGIRWPTRGSRYPLWGAGKGGLSFSLSHHTCTQKLPEEVSDGPSATRFLTASTTSGAGSCQVAR